MAKIHPLQQGEMDSLCGLYSVLNSIYALFPKMKDCDLVRLFNHLSRHLSKERKDTIDLLINGMSLALLRSLVQAASQHQSRYSRHIEQISIRPNWKSADNFIAQLGSVVGDGAVAIVLLSHSGKHWTVVNQITTRKIVLLDSAGSNEIKRKHCALNRRSGRVTLYPASTLLIRRKE